MVHIHYVLVCQIQFHLQFQKIMGPLYQFFRQILPMIILFRFQLIFQLLVIFSGALGKPQISDVVSLESSLFPSSLALACLGCCRLIYCPPIFILQLVHHQHFRPILLLYIPCLGFSLCHLPLRSVFSPLDAILPTIPRKKMAFAWNWRLPLVLFEICRRTFDYKSRRFRLCFCPLVRPLTASPPTNT